MTIYLMNTPTDTEHCIKELPDDWEENGIEGTVKGEASVDSMIFIVNGNVTDENYCYIPAFRRYYWITERNVLRTGLTELTLKSDPFMSFYHGQEGETGIEDLPVYVTRCSPEGRDDTELAIGFNAYLNDAGVPVLEKVRTTMYLCSLYNKAGNLINFDYDNTTYDYWLATVG